MSTKRQTLLIFFATLLGVGIFLFGISSARGASDMEIVYFGDQNCAICHEKVEITRAFASEHPEVTYTEYMLDFTDPDSFQFVQDYFAGIDYPVSVPSAVLNASGKISVLKSQDITETKLDAWLRGEFGGSTNDNLNLWFSFGAGILVGVSACMLLLLSVVGTTMTTIEKKSQYAAMSVGLVAGLVVAYMLLSAIFIWLVEVVGIFVYFKYIFGAVLLIIGIWQIVEFKKEKSVIFGTPGKVKGFLKDFINRRTGVAAFLVGIVFAFVKIPCFGGPFLSIIYAARDNPLLFSYIAVYFVGMLIPIIIVLVLMGIGLQSDRVNDFRLKYRPHLRLLSGIVLIVVTIYLVFIGP